MKKKPIILSVACLMFGLGILNTAILAKNEKSSVIDLSSLILAANADGEGCIFNPNGNSGRCHKNVNGAEWNCMYPYSQTPDCISD